MKTILKLSAFFTILMLASSCFPNKKLTGQKSTILPLSDTVTVRDGSIVYGLPRTVFNIVVETERIIGKPGPYARFAGDMLGLKDVIQSESESWAVNGIRINSAEELDPSEFYVIESNTLFSSNVLALKREGLILDLNPSVFNSARSQTEYKESSAAGFSSTDLGSDEYFQVQRDTAYKRVSVDSSFIRIPYIVEKKKILPIDQMAERAAKRLMEMRDGKHLILTGEATVFPQNDAAIIEMNRLEKEYTELFTGKTIKEVRTYSFLIIPEKEMAGKPVTLFRFSELTGPLSGSDKGGVPVTIQFIPEKKTKDLTIINKKQASPESAVYDKLYYRVPDVVNLKISVGSENLLNSRKLIYQFGEVIQLPANYLIGK
jgi:hypothetical protein